MRCKNCGTENDDNRYICENCGSPLYDEESINNDIDNSQTQAFKPLNPDDELDMNNTPNNDKLDNEKKADKKSIIAIAILAVILVAVIVSIIVVAQGKKKAEASTTNSTTITTSTTENTTREETTTEKTTTTTTTTTTQTTTVKSYSIKLVSKGGGTVNGSGTYEDGDNVTIVATPDEGYVFDGWYSNGAKISSAESYSFTATKNISISAVFVVEEIETLTGDIE